MSTEIQQIILVPAREISLVSYPSSSFWSASAPVSLLPPSPPLLTSRSLKFGGVLMIELAGTIS